jgi:Predicted transcriptional regulators
MHVFKGGRLADLRKSAGLSQEKLARKLDVSQQSVGRWENGNAEPSIGHLFALADIYGVTLDELLDRPSPSAAIGGDGDIDALTGTVALDQDEDTVTMKAEDFARLTAALRRISAAAKIIDGIIYKDGK